MRDARVVVLSLRGTTSVSAQSPLDRVRPRVDCSKGLGQRGTRTEIGVRHPAGPERADLGDRALERFHGAM